MEKMKMQTNDIADENLRKLATLFPDAVTETVNADGEVVRDSTFATDSVAANFEQIFATCSPDTTRRIL